MLERGRQDKMLGFFIIFITEFRLPMSRLSSIGRAPDCQLLFPLSQTKLTTVIQEVVQLHISGGTVFDPLSRQFLDSLPRGGITFVELMFESTLLLRKHRSLRRASAKQLETFPHIT